VLTFRIDLPFATYPKPEDRRSAVVKIEQQLRDVPGVQVVGGINKLPLTGSGPQTPYAWNAETQRSWESISADWRSVTPGYFQSMGIRFVAGRPFTEQDDEGHPRVVVIDEMLARKAWPGESALGKRLTMEQNDPPEKWLTVVGVIGHVRAHDVSRQIREQIYLPFRQNVSKQMFFTLKTACAPEQVIGSASSAVHTVDPALAVHRVQTMQSYWSLALGEARFTVALSAVFAAIALLLTSVGIYGLVSYITAQRFREFGIRLALGAQKSSVYRTVLGQGLRLALSGIGLGVVAGLASTRVLRGLLYGVSSMDPVTFATVPILLAGVVLLAVFLPAGRATRVDPVIALRTE
jgi:putative ABC transport system permease protein